MGASKRAKRESKRDRLGAAKRLRPWGVRRADFRGWTLVKVEACDLAAGVRGSLRWCPVGEALARAGFEQVRVGSGVLSVGVPGVPGSLQTVFLPDRVAGFVERLDTGGSVLSSELPFTFAVPLMPAGWHRAAWDRHCSRLPF